MPGQPPRAVLAALDAPPLVLEDATPLLANPAAEAARLLAPLKLDPWREAVATAALVNAVAAL